MRDKYGLEEISKKNKTLLLVLGGVFLLLIFLYSIIKGPTSVDDVHKQHFFEGRVTKMYVDKNEHYTMCTELNTGHEIRHMQSNFYSKIEIGDSLSKKYGDPVYYIYKKDGNVIKYKANAL